MHILESAAGARHFPKSVEAMYGRRSLKTYKGLSFGSHPSRLKLQYGHLTKSSLSGIGQ